MSANKPMLAVAAGELSLLNYPLFASTKLDGIRATIHVDGPKTRSLKPIPNRHIAAMLATLPAGLDGEIGTVGENGGIDFRTTTGNVMRETGAPEFVFYVFDHFIDPRPFGYRYQELLAMKARGVLPSWVSVLEQTTVKTPAEVEGRFADALREGQEGLILRDPNGSYKHGRSTLKEQGMLKVKPWEDAEAICIDVLEENENQNEAMTNELGRTHRSSAKAGKVGKGTLGALVVKSPRWPTPFKIGTIGDNATRDALWADKPVGKHIKFKFVTVGGYDVPRHAVFLGVRDARDM